MTRTTRPGAVRVGGSPSFPCGNERMLHSGLPALFLLNVGCQGEGHQRCCWEMGTLPSLLHVDCWENGTLIVVSVGCSGKGTPFIICWGKDTVFVTVVWILGKRCSGGYRVGGLVMGTPFVISVDM